MTQQIKHKIEHLMDLHRSKNGIKLYLPEGMDISDGSAFITFYHIDGMYSYCKTEKGGFIHLSAMTPIESFKDGYQIIKG